MAYRGLFIGIDRHASSAVGWLSCARRDAVALHALFADTFGSGGELLTDADATREAIQDRFTALESAAPDDLVVVAFSGHGTPTHELVTYDADPTDLTGTCIPLGMLHQWFDRIPSRRLVCILDCCFSGGVGAKVLQVDAQPRHLYSAHSPLDQLSGSRRLVLTASTAAEEAWEHASLGHGLLTHALIEALQGAEEVRDAGKVPVYRLLEFVTRHVTDAAARVGRPQPPTLRGEIDGELAWPVFCPGPAYRAAFPERVRAPATADLHLPQVRSVPAHAARSRRSVRCAAMPGSITPRARRNQISAGLGLGAPPEPGTGQSILSDSHPEGCGHPLLCLFAGWRRM